MLVETETFFSEALCEDIITKFVLEPESYMSYSMFTLRSLVRNINNFPDLLALITGLAPFDSVRKCASHT